eukprot:5405813-Pleurochrysis_carterae.AAC.1
MKRRPQPAPTYLWLTALERSRLQHAGACHLSTRDLAVNKGYEAGWRSIPRQKHRKRTPRAACRKSGRPAQAACANAHSNRPNAHHHHANAHIIKPAQSETAAAEAELAAGPTVQ